MKPRPIIFSAEMVRAILDGRKTQTRRICKPANDAPLSYVVDGEDGTFGDEEGDFTFKCPYGQIGGELWVRETFSLHPEQAGIAYRADGEEFEDGDGWLWEPKWASPIHMPRKLSRITLRITDTPVCLLR